MHRYCGASFLDSSCFALTGCGGDDSVVARAVSLGLCNVRFLDVCYMYLVSCEVFYNVALRLDCFHRVWIHDGNVGRAYAILHGDYGLSFCGIFQVFLLSLAPPLLLRG